MQEGVQISFTKLLMELEEEITTEASLLEQLEVANEGAVKMMNRIGEDVEARMDEMEESDFEPLAVKEEMFKREEKVEERRKVKDSEGGEEEEIMTRDNIKKQSQLLVNAKATSRKIRKAIR